VKRFELARRAVGDLKNIWDFVVEDNFDAADRLLEDFYRAFNRLGLGCGKRTPHVDRKLR